MSVVAIAVSWLIFATMLLGIGRSISKLVERLRPPTDVSGSLQSFWLGLAALLAYLQIWSLFRGVDVWAWLLPTAVAITGFAVLPPARPTWNARSLLLGVFHGGALVWLANRSSLPALHYDTGLYHLSAIDFATRYGTVPGLGNLHVRLGTSVSHFLLVAFLGSGPWSAAGHHLANGFLSMALVVELSTRIAGVRRGPAASSLSRASALLLLSAAMLFPVLDPSRFTASPSLDFAALVFFVVGTMYSLDAAHEGNQRDSIAALGLCAVAVTIRIVYLPAFMLVLAILIAFSTSNPRLRPPVFALLLPSTLFLGQVARSLLLSGYPHFPAGLGRIPVDWAVPMSESKSYLQVVRSWARTPFQTSGDTDEVLTSWNWLIPWLRRLDSEQWLDVLSIAGRFAALAAAASAITRIALRMLKPTAGRDPGSSANPAQAALLVAPSAATLLLWFFAAPDPRFVFGALVVAFTGFLLLTDSLVGFRDRFPTTAATAAFIVILTLSYGSLGWRDATRDGPYGTSRSPDPELTEVSIQGGGRLFVPVAGDQCWDAFPCTPVVAQDLRLRGAGIEDGFTVSR